MAEKNIDVAFESTSQQILTSGAKETTSQQILSAVSNSGGGSSFPNYSRILTGETDTSSSYATTITGKGRLEILYIQTGTANAYVNIDGTGQVTIQIGSGLGFEVYFNRTITVYSSKSMRYIAQVE